MQQYIENAEILIPFTNSDIAHGTEGKFQLSSSFFLGVERHILEAILESGLVAGAQYGIATKYTRISMRPKNFVYRNTIYLISCDAG